MKITILVFSPSGNTLKVGKMLQISLIKKGAEVQLVDSTRSKMIFEENDRGKFLERNIGNHDVLVIGGPVYSHHMQHNLLKIIKALPLPGGKWGCLAIPFTTFGTISSGEALYEAAELLKQTGRKCVLGMKVDTRWECRRSSALFNLYGLEYNAIVFSKAIEKPFYNSARNSKAYIERTISTEV